MFPETERVRFKNNPLTEVVCQLRFPPILKIASSPPADFQDRVRFEFPSFSEQLEVPDVHGMPPILAQMLMKQAEHSPTYRFESDSDHQQILSLTKDFLALQDNNYVQWESFKSSLLSAESAFREIYRPAHYARIGLLYRNVIDLEKIGAVPGTAWSDLIRPELCGALATTEYQNRVDHSMTTSLLRADEKGSVVKFEHGIVQISKQDHIVPVYVLSADFFKTGKVEPENAADLLDSYHTMARNLFRWAILPKLFELLEPYPCDVAS